MRKADALLVGKEGCAMRSMLRKDVYVMGKYTATLSAAWLAIIAVCTRIPGLETEPLYYLMSVYALSVALSAVSVDQECRWDRFAAMTPLRPWMLVLEKYLFAYGVMALMTALGAAAQWLGTGTLDRVDLWVMVVLVLLALAMALPVTYRFGRKRGGALLMAFWGAAAAAIMGTAFLNYAAIEAAFGWMDDIPALTLGVRAAGGLLAANVLSFCLSIRFYTRRQRGWYDGS